MAGTVPWISKVSKSPLTLRAGMMMSNPANVSHMLMSMNFHFGKASISGDMSEVDCVPPATAPQPQQAPQAGVSRVGGGVNSGALTFSLYTTTPRKTITNNNTISWFRNTWYRLNESVAFFSATFSNVAMSVRMVKSTSTNTLPCTVIARGSSSSEPEPSSSCSDAPYSVSLSNNLSCRSRFPMVTKSR